MKLGPARAGRPPRCSVCTVYHSLSFTFSTANVCSINGTVCYCQWNASRFTFVLLTMMASAEQNWSLNVIMLRVKSFLNTVQCKMLPISSDFRSKSISSRWRHLVNESVTNTHHLYTVVNHSIQLWLVFSRTELVNYNRLNRLHSAWSESGWGWVGANTLSHQFEHSNDRVFAMSHRYDVHLTTVFGYIE